EDHIRLLARFSQSVVLAFDSDEAGARAAERAFPFFEQYPVELAVLILPEGLDPADFVLARGEQAGEELTILAER
ncbi:MAG: DNA primase, partial [Actinobacteria bacterium]